MNISEKLKNLVEILSHRGVGHTTLLRTGTDTYNKPFIQLGMSHSQLNESDLLTNPNAIGLSISEIELTEHNGLKLPVAIDNYVIRELASDALFTIECMQGSIDRKKEVMEELMNIVEYYQDQVIEMEKASLELSMTPWWKIGKIIKLESHIHKMIMDHNIGSPKIIDMFQKILNIANTDKWQNQ